MEDVRLDDLFRTIVKVEFHGRTLYVRALSELDLQAREEATLYAAAKKRKEMLTPDTRDNLMYLQWAETAELEQLTATIVNVEMTNLLREAFLQIQPQILPEPENATQQEKEETLLARQAEAKRTAEARTKFVDDKKEQLIASLENKTREQVLQRARLAQVEFQTRAVSQAEFDSQLIARAFFLDADCEKPFASVAQASEMEPRYRQELVSLYSREMQRISDLDLKYFLLTDASTPPSPLSAT